MKPELASKAILKARKRVHDAEVALKEVERKTILGCKHNNQAECSYHCGGDYSSHSPPLRVCLNCGFVEEGWSTYEYLKAPSHEVGTIGRVDIYMLRTITMTRGMKVSMFHTKTSFKTFLTFDHSIVRDWVPGYKGRDD